MADSTLDLIEAPAEAAELLSEVPEWHPHESPEYSALCQEITNVFRFLAENPSHWNQRVVFFPQVSLQIPEPWASQIIREMRARITSEEESPGVQRTPFVRILSDAEVASLPAKVYEPLTLGGKDEFDLTAQVAGVTYTVRLTAEMAYQGEVAYPFETADDVFAFAIVGGELTISVDPNPTAAGAEFWQAVERAFCGEIDARLKQAKRRAARFAAPHVQQPVPGQHWVSSSQFHYALREALAQGKFGLVEGSAWPTAIVQRSNVRGVFRLKPESLDEQPYIPLEQQQSMVETMFERCKQLGDLDADVNDAFQISWLEQAGDNALADALCGVDHILELRGVQKHKGGHGRRGGYTVAERGRILEAITRIKDVEIDVELDKYPDGKRKGRHRGEKPKKWTEVIRSRLWVISDMKGQRRLDGYLDVHEFLYHPGRAVAALLIQQKQLALMSAKALQYDPYRQTWEKRLTRYVGWLWRIQWRKTQDHQAHTVKGLLAAVGVTLDPRLPHRTKDRLEKALDTLLKDRVIAHWQYRRWDESTCEKRRWGQDWLKATIEIEAPEPVRDFYRRLEIQTPAAKRPAQIEAAWSRHEQLREWRKAQGLSQAVAAERLNVSQARYSQIEGGKGKPSATLAKRIQDLIGAA